MICGLQVSKDGAGFPVVAWLEDRGFGYPEALRRARVECRIMKDGATGELLFVARGTVRDPYGKFEEGKPWARIQGFRIHGGEGLYRTRSETELWRHVIMKPPAKWALSDSTLVAVAEFWDDCAIHINCAHAPQNDLNRLHATLVREFVTNQSELLGSIGRNGFTWPVGDDRVMTYDPGRTWWSDQAKPSLVTEALDRAIVLGLIGGSLALISWIAGFWRI